MTAKMRRVLKAVVMGTVLEAVAVEVEVVVEVEMAPITLHRVVRRTNAGVRRFGLLWTLLCLRVVPSRARDEFRVVCGVALGELPRRTFYALCEGVASVSARAFETSRMGGTVAVMPPEEVMLLFKFGAPSLWKAGRINACSRVCSRLRLCLCARVFAGVF